MRAGMGSDPFVEYYEKKSVAPAAVAHFVRLRQLLLRVLGAGERTEQIRVLDIGCNAGTFSRIWAGVGCSVGAIDVNADLVAVARQRADAEGVAIDFRTGTAECLPWPDSHFDIVVMPELLEHVVNWRQCLSEAARVLRRGGVLYVSTTNRLCPMQEEFTLPLYSWYPGWLKHRCVQLSLTTHREWVNHAAFPAVTWFDPYWLGMEFRKVGLEPLDRFDLFAAYGENSVKKRVGRLAGSFPPIRFLGHVLSPGTRLAGRKV
jgi:SAM-dependent methyltransferase